MKTIENLIKNIKDYRDGVPLMNADCDLLDWVLDELESIFSTKSLVKNELSETKKSNGIMTNIKDLIDDVKYFGMVEKLPKENASRLNLVIERMLEIKPTRVLIDHELTEHEKLELITNFHEWYANTNQDSEEYGQEFFYVVEEILTDHIPVKLMYLVDYQDYLLKMYPSIEDKILKAMSLEVKQKD